MASFPLTDDLPLTVRNLVKLLNRGRILGIRSRRWHSNSKGKPRIWGLMDQGVHYSTFVVKEASSAPEMPGMFQVLIQGTGGIPVYKAYILLGSLKQDSLVKGQQRVFQSGPVHLKLMKSIKEFQRQVRKKAGEKLYDERGHWNESLESNSISTPPGY